MRMRQKVVVLTALVAMLSGVSHASASPAAGDARSLTSRDDGYAVMVCHAAFYRDTVAVLCQMLIDSSDGRFTSADTYYIGSGGHAAFPATDWYNQGCRAILTFTEYAPADTTALGDSLGRFLQLGGGVVEAVFADCTPSQIKGTWRSAYAPFTVSSPSGTAGSMGAVRQPAHPMMSGVSAVSVGGFRTGNKNGTLRSTNCVSLAEYTDAGLCLAACFDSAGRRAASIGLFPLTYWQSSASGQWCRLIVNALDWTAVGPSVGVTAPNGGESWHADSVCNITWTQTDNGVRDSIYYSTNAGLSWTGVAYLATPPAPPEYAWTVPNTPTTRARIKVVTWNEADGRVEDASNANFTIVSSGGIEQHEKDAAPLGFALSQPCPNPTASRTQVSYTLPRRARVELDVYDVTGTLVRRLMEGTQSAGYRHADWNTCDNRGRAVAPGVYYCRFRSGDYAAIRKLIVHR